MKELKAWYRKEHDVELKARSVKPLKYCFELDFLSELFDFYFRERCRDREAKTQGGIVEIFFVNIVNIFHHHY